MLIKKNLHLPYILSLPLLIISCEKSGNNTQNISPTAPAPAKAENTNLSTDATPINSNIALINSVILCQHIEKSDDKNPFYFCSSPSGGGNPTAQSPNTIGVPIDISLAANNLSAVITWQGQSLYMVDDSGTSVLLATGSSSSMSKNTVPGQNGSPTGSFTSYLGTCLASKPCPELAGPSTQTTPLSFDFSAGKAVQYYVIAADGKTKTTYAVNATGVVTSTFCIHDVFQPVSSQETDTHLENQVNLSSTNAFLEFNFHGAIDQSNNNQPKPTAQITWIDPSIINEQSPNDYNIRNNYSNCTVSFQSQSNSANTMQITIIECIDNNATSSQAKTIKVPLNLTLNYVYADNNPNIASAATQITQDSAVWNTTLVSDAALSKTMQSTCPTKRN